jgi:hypothetical protein
MLATSALAAGACGDRGESSPDTDEPPVDSATSPSPDSATAPATKPSRKPPGVVVTDPLELDLPQSDESLDPGQQVWAAYRTGTPPSWIFGKASLVERGGRFRISISADGAHELPPQFVTAATPAEGLRPGSPVLVQAEGSARFGRIQAISADKLRVMYAIGHDRIAEGGFTAEDVRTFDRRDLRSGTPVLFNSGNHSYIGNLALATGEKAYVICGELLELPRTAVTALDLSKLFEPGDRVVAVPDDAETCEARDGEVLEMKDAGLRYRVELTGGDKIDAPFALVGLHPSLPRPKAP